MNQGCVQTPCTLKIFPIENHGIHCTQDNLINNWTLNTGRWKQKQKQNQNIFVADGCHCNGVVYQISIWGPRPFKKTFLSYYEAELNNHLDKAWMISYSVENFYR